MANFEQAVKWHDEGYDTIRKGHNYCWKSYSAELYLHSIRDDIKVAMSPADIKATDWEIYQEEDNWNAKSFKNVGRIEYSWATFETLKEKIWEDILKDKENSEEPIPKWRVKQILDKRWGF